MSSTKVNWIEYMCTYCGTKTSRPVSKGRPAPGKCPRRKSDLPHRWVINRKY